jgi:hypothetical protein
VGFVAYERKFSWPRFSTNILGIGKYHDYLITNNVWKTLIYFSILLRFLLPWCHQRTLVLVLWKYSVIWAETINFENMRFILFSLRFLCHQKEPPTKHKVMKFWNLLEFIWQNVKIQNPWYYIFANWSAYVIMSVGISFLYVFEAALSDDIT